MAKIVDGLLGHYVGTIGPVVGSTWKGIAYVKAKPRKKKTKRKAEPKELANREKFGEAQRWLQPILPFVRLGFKGYTPTVEGFVAAKSLLLKNSFEGEYPDRRINPALVKLSAGTLPLPGDISLSLEGNGLHFSWDPTPPRDGNSMDQVMLLAYDIHRGLAEIEAPGEFRRSGKASLPVEAGVAFHVYLAFVAHDRSRQSESVYLGEVKA